MKHIKFLAIFFIALWGMSIEANTKTCSSINAYILSLAFCRKALVEKNKKYEDSEILEIREFLYKIAKVELEAHQTKENDCLTKSNCY